MFPKFAKTIKSAKISLVPSVVSDDQPLRARKKPPMQIRLNRCGVLRNTMSSQWNQSGTAYSTPGTTVTSLNCGIKNETNSHFNSLVLLFVV